MYTHVSTQFVVLVLGTLGFVCVVLTIPTFIMYRLLRAERAKPQPELPPVYVGVPDPEIAGNVLTNLVDRVGFDRGNRAYLEQFARDFSAFRSAVEEELSALRNQSASSDPQT